MERTIWVLICFAITGMIAGVLWIVPIYGVWQQGMQGESELKRATWNRQILVQEAQAKKDAAQALAEAEVTRASGVAKANKIIGDSLKGNDAYLHYLWVNTLEHGNNQLIYVPTENQLPLLEASRLHHSTPKQEE